MASRPVPNVVYRKIVVTPPEEKNVGSPSTDTAAVRRGIAFIAGSWALKAVNNRYVVRLEYGAATQPMLQRVCCCRAACCLDLQQMPAGLDVDYLNVYCFATPRLEVKVTTRFLLLG